jgi:acyl carrier protein
MNNNQNSTIFEKVVSIIRESLYLPNVRITAETNLVEDLKVDSLDLITTVIDLEAVFGLEFPDDAMARFRTVGEIAQYLRCCMNVGETAVSPPGSVPG